MKRELSALAFGIMLAGCGGSSGGSDASGVYQSDDRVFGELRNNAVKCNISEPLVSADVIVHSDDGSIISESSTDAAGKFDIQWPKKAAHLTLTYKKTNENLSAEVSVDTMLNIQAGDVGITNVFSSSLNERCDCEFFNIDFSDIKANYPEHDIFVDGANWSK